MNQPTMVHQQPPPQRRQPMGVSIGALVFSNLEAAQVHLEREAREHRARCAEKYEQILTGGAA